MAQNSTHIEHIGTIISIDNGMACVRIEQYSACSVCHAKGVCGASDSAEKVVEATCGDMYVQLGQQVMVAGRSELGLQAVLLAYLLPFFLLFITLLVSSIYIQNEGLVAALSIAILIPFYVVLYLFRNKLKKKFSFFIKQIILN